MGIALASRFECVTTMSLVGIALASRFECVTTMSLVGIALASRFECVTTMSLVGIALASQFECVTTWSSPYTHLVAIATRVEYLREGVPRAVRRVRNGSSRKDFKPRQFKPLT